VDIRIGRRKAQNGGYFYLIVYER